MRPEGLEPPAFWSVARRSIQLSYGRIFLPKCPRQDSNLYAVSGTGPSNQPVYQFQHVGGVPTAEVRPSAYTERSGPKCSRRDSNPHGVNPHRVLNPARLPIPPPERCSSHHDGAEGNRTPDLLNAIQALSQLSYGPLTRPAKPSPSKGRRTSIFQSSTSGADETRTRDLRCDRPAL
jgi:hypothetical protein